MDDVLLATVQELGVGQPPTEVEDRERLLQVARSRPGQPLDRQIAGLLVAALAAPRYPGLDSLELRAMSDAIAEILLETPSTCGGLTQLWRWLQEATLHAGP